jgi:hypothetical protein
MTERGDTQLLKMEEQIDGMCMHFSVIHQQLSTLHGADPQQAEELITGTLSLFQNLDDVILDIRNEITRRCQV